MKVTRIENSFFSSNTYLLSQDEHPYVWLVDCGDYWRVKKLLNGKYVKGVLLTHTHADHIYGINDLLSDFSDATVITNGFGIKALSDPKLNLTKYHDEVPDYSVSPNVQVKAAIEGDLIELFPNCRAHVLETSGHDMSCLSYKISNYLFTGDSYIPGVKLTAKFPNSDKKVALLNFNRLKELEGELLICPGHGKMNQEI